MTSQQLKCELKKWEDNGLRARFWWRDDDAIDATSRLDRLAGIASHFDIHVGLAVIPGKLKTGLIQSLALPDSRFFPMCHGWQHTNHNEGTNAHPSEFGDGRPLSDLRLDATKAFAAFKSHFPRSNNICFVPPFSNLSVELETELQAMGFTAVSNTPGIATSRFAKLHARSNFLPLNPLGMVRLDARTVHRRVDAHVDLIDWRKATAQSDTAIQNRILGELRLRRKGYLAVDAPIGILTHHLVHDEPIWKATEKWLRILQGSPAIEFPHPENLLTEMALPKRKVAPEARTEHRNIVDARP